MTTTHVKKFDFTTSYPDEQVTRGTVHKVIGATQQTRKYVFVYNAGADSISAGDVVPIFTAFAFGSVSVTDATDFEITDGTTTRQLVAGIAGATIATTEFGWLWFSGYGTHSITTDTNVAAGHGLLCAQNAKLATPNSTAASAHLGQFGVAMAADSGSALTSAILGGDGMFPWDG